MSLSKKSYSQKNYALSFAKTTRVMVIRKKNKTILKTSDVFFGNKMINFKKTTKFWIFFSKSSPNTQFHVQRDILFI